MQVLIAKHALFIPLIALVIAKYASLKRITILVVSALVLTLFISIYGFARQEFMYTLGLEHNIFFSYIIIFSTVVSIFTSREKGEALALFSCLFLLIAFFENEAIILFPIARMYIDYSLLQHEKIETKRAHIFHYRIFANICEVALLYLFTCFEFNHDASRVLSLAIFFIFVFQMMLSYYFEQCFREKITPLKVVCNFVNYFLYPGWALMLMRQVKCAESITALSVYVLVLGVFIILIDAYFSKKLVYAMLVVNILLFFCPVKGQEYILYKLSSYSFMAGLFILWTHELLTMAPTSPRFGKILHYIFTILIAMPFMGNSNLLKCIVLLRLHKEYLAIYLIILLSFMALQAFYRSNGPTHNSQVLIKNFQPFWIIIVTNILVIIALNLSLFI